MALYFETACRYDKMGENGEVKKVTEKFLIDAMSFTEAESRTTEERRPYISGDFTVSAAKRTKIAEVVGDKEPDRYYLAKLAFISIDEKSGVEKRSVSQLLVGADNFIRAIDEINEAMRGTMADYEIVSLSESPILEVYPAKTSADE